MKVTEEKLRKVIRREIKEVMTGQESKSAKYEADDIDHFSFVSKQIGNVLGSTERGITELRNRKKENDSQYIDEGLKILRSVADKLREW